MRTVCLIPARGGSVRIPRKNVKLFAGRPIIEYSIETAKASLLFDEIVVSTDDNEIAYTASRAGARIHYRVPDDGTRGTQEVAAEVLKRWKGGRGFSMACVLYATAPLLTWRDLYYGLRACSEASNYLYSYSANYRNEDIGGFYWGPSAAFVEDVPLEGNSLMVRIPDARAIDINTMDDWDRAESMYAAIHG